MQWVSRGGVIDTTNLGDIMPNYNIFINDNIKYLNSLLYIVAYNWEVNNKY